MKVHLVDGTYELFRHFFGAPPHRNAEGEEVAAVRGVLASVLQLIDEMRRTSPEFAAWWSRHEVALSGQGRKVLRHPTAGTLHFEHAVFKFEETPEQRLILYTALPTAGTPEKLARLMADAGR